jgi:hypothetical protein
VAVEAGAAEADQSERTEQDHADGGGQAAGARLALSSQAKDRHSILFNQRINGHDRQLVFDSLTDKDAIERIAMMGRQGVQPGDALLAEWERANAMPPTLCRKVNAWRLWKRQLADLELDRSLP